MHVNCLLILHILYVLGTIKYNKNDVDDDILLCILNIRFFCIKRKLGQITQNLFRNFLTGVKAIRIIFLAKLSKDFFKAYAGQEVNMIR